MKKFYSLVTHHKADGGYEIHLDGKPVKTPSKAVLIIPSETLANDVVKEWATQDETIDPETMPLTQILTTGTDRIHDRDSIKTQVLAYLDTDLLCYRTDSPEDIARRQADTWDPLLETYTKTCINGHCLETTTGLAALKQPEEARTSLSDDIDTLDTWQFTALQMVTALTGSVVLAHLFVRGHIDSDAILKAAFVEEDHKAEIYNEKKYGPDPDTKKRKDRAATDLAAIKRILDTV